MIKRIIFKEDSYLGNIAKKTLNIAKDIALKSNPVGQLLSQSEKILDDFGISFEKFEDWKSDRIVEHLIKDVKKNGRRKTTTELKRLIKMNKENNPEVAKKLQEVYDKYTKKLRTDKKEELKDK
jgi:hypothetical protein